MTGSVLLGLGIVVLLVCAAYAVVCAVRPAATALTGSSWIRAGDRHGRAALSWLTAKVAAELVLLALGAALVFTLASVFVEVLDAVVDDDDLTVIDRPVVDWLAAHRTPGLNRVVIAVTDLGGAVALTIASVAAVGYVSWRRRSVYPLALGLLTLGVAQLIVLGIKVAIGRERPNPPGQVVAETGYSFPSGHSTSSLLGFALLAWLVCMLTGNRTVWATAWLAAAGGAVLVGASRVYLGVHYPSDVLGGWTLGLTWLAVVAVAAWVWRMRAARNGAGRHSA
ncbi:phosphatase PAP2 family protein [Catellatospora sp. NPDC049609]|uniref:phosphatase PAP2 family protein n=1 Tax=Catellatospora sp. NPDC049609 TaxID=3155505 RepID=UPI003417BA8D